MAWYKQYSSSVGTNGNDWGWLSSCLKDLCISSISLSIRIEAMAFHNSGYGFGVRQRSLHFGRYCQLRARTRRRSIVRHLLSSCKAGVIPSNPHRLSWPFSKPNNSCHPLATWQKRSICWSVRCSVWDAPNSIILPSDDIGTGSNKCIRCFLYMAVITCRNLAAPILRPNSVFVRDLRVTLMYVWHWFVFELGHAWIVLTNSIILASGFTSIFAASAILMA